LNSGGTSAATNEATLTVRSGCELPGAPGSLTAAADGRTVAVAWMPGADALSYQLEVGSQQSRNDVLVADLRSLTTTMTAVDVAAGTYYLRVRSLNACGSSAPSNEAAVFVR
jgi:predicted phage tail protein